MSFKRLFSRALGAAPGRLHMAAHSHHLWPDASFAGQVECWEDAARLADSKWDRIMGEVWPEAQGYVASELGSGIPSAIVFAGNTHDLLIRLVAACPRRARRPLRILTSDGEFHSARRQFARWEEAGEVSITRVPTEPFANFAERLHDLTDNDEHDLIFVSQMMFGSGLLLDDVGPIVAAGRPDGPWVAIDGYHSFMAIDRPFAAPLGETAFFLGGGYKYAMAGEGVAFMHCPPGFGPRPPVTGWYAEVDEPGFPSGQVGYAPDAMRFMGATFDASGLYRFNAVQRMLAEERLSTATISAHLTVLHRRLLNALDGSPLDRSTLLNPLTSGPHARFLAWRTERAADWSDQLMRDGCIVNARGDVLRVGLGLYHDESDIDAFATLVRALA